jgi:hypothetical protein
MVSGSDMLLCPICLTFSYAMNILPSFTPSNIVQLCKKFFPDPHGILQGEEEPDRVVVPFLGC